MSTDLRLVEQEREMPLAVSELVRCPQCGKAGAGEYMHLGPVAVTQEYDTITIARGPALSHNGLAKPCGRGSRVRIRFLGECGHRADLIFQFHKGVTFSFWTDITDLRDFPEGLDSELWRD